MCRSVAALTLAASLSLPRFVWAEQTAEYRETIVVTADRLEEPLSETTDAITVITRATIERKQYRTVADALREVPGLDVVRSGSPGKLTSVFVRGADSDQVLVLIDGVNVNDPVYGGFDLANLSTDNLERIEVLRGPQSPLYGSDAIAGVIQILTRRGVGASRLEASFEGGNYATGRASLAAAGQTGRLHYSVAGSRFTTDGLGQVSPFEQSFATDHDAFEQTVFSGRAGYDSGARQAELSLRYTDGSAQVPLDGSFAPSPRRGGTSEALTLSASYRQRLAQGWHGRVRLSHADREERAFDPDDVFGFTFFDTLFETWTLELQSDLELEAGHLVTIGYELDRSDADERDSFGAIAGQVTTQGMYVQDKLRIGERLRLTAGFRYDHDDRFGSDTNPRISASYELGGGAKLRGSFGTGFRAPLLGELLPAFFGNPELEPEQSTSVDLGFEQRLAGDRGRLGVSYFHNDFDNLIVFDSGTGRFENVARARTRGLEAFGEWRVIGATVIGANYTLLDADNLSADEALLRRPRHRGTIDLRHPVGSRWMLGAILHLVGQRLDDDFRFDHPGREINPGYVKLDLLADYNWRPELSFFGRLENALDDDYQEALGFDTLGLAVRAGVRLVLD
jgi:vitamin B12 transporter